MRGGVFDKTEVSQLGDFEDIFGAGADIEAIIDGICADEDRCRVKHDLVEKDDLVDHFLWFQTYAAAETWEKAHRGVGFTRRPLQGGYEVKLRDRRSAAEKWRSSSTCPDAADSEGARSPVTLVHAEGLEDLVISHGDFRVRLAEQTSSHLVLFLAWLRDEVPSGRAGLSPIIIPTDRFNAFFRRLPNSLSHELEMGLGVMAVFCNDHHFLIGRRVGKSEIQIWPWILEMECGGGKPGSYFGSGCFLCDHHKIENREIPLHCWYHQQDMNYPTSESYRHHIDKALYARDARPTDLARCVTDWIARLAPFDARLGPTRRAPSCVTAVKKKDTSGLAALQYLCDALACAIAIHQKIDSDMRVEVSANTRFDILTQAKRDEVTLAWRRLPNTVNLYSQRRREPCAIPDIAGLDVEKALPEWRDLVDLFPAEGGRHDSDSGFRLGQGSFSVEGLSAHQKVEASRVLTSLLEMDLPPIVRELIGSPPAMF